MSQIHQLEREQISAVRDLMKDYLAWAFALQEGTSDAPTFAGVDDELRDLPGVFAPPKGRFLVAEVDGVLGGCVALKPIDEETSELKRLYVRPEARGHNLGFLLVQRLVEEARLAGYKRIILDSHMSMTAAHSIYRKVGFRDVAAWDGFPEEMKPFVVFMEMDLRA